MKLKLTAVFTVICLSTGFQSVMAEKKHINGKTVKAEKNEK